MNKNKEMEIKAFEAEKMEIVELTNSFLAIRNTFYSDKDLHFNESKLSFNSKIAQVVIHECHDDNLTREIRETYYSLINYCNKFPNIWHYQESKFSIDAAYSKFLDNNSVFYR